MNKVLKLQHLGFTVPTVVEYNERILATNFLDIEGTCKLWRYYFGFYPDEKVDIAMIEKELLAIRTYPFNASSIYDLLRENGFLPRAYTDEEEPARFGMYLNIEIEKLKAENAAFRKALARAIDSSDDVCGYCAYYIPTKPDENCTPCGHLGECVDGVLQHFMQKEKDNGK